jgi:2-polyprenyl-3-methyl-5-hydroxy-6-metoxy-1,4-benzoquinol methylase
MESPLENSMSKNEGSTASDYYKAEYFDWQKNIGMFGGWANSFKFKTDIKSHHTVIDFGCGGGFLLKNLDCKRKVGLEPNLSAVDSIVACGVEHFQSPTAALQALGAEVADIIISNHALEHTLNPLQELKNLAPLLKKGGTIHFFIPCDSIHYS